MKIKCFLYKYDFWVGLYWSEKDKILYFCPLPCCVISFQSDNEYGKMLAHIAETKGIDG